MRAIVVGGGIFGVTAARAPRDRGHDVTLIERPVGGDMYDVTGWRAFMHATAQLAGVWIIAASARAIDPLELAGIRTQQTRESLQITGPYRWVRHPLYLGWMLALFGTAHMTGDRLTFAAITSVYLVIAVPWEERSLRQSFGAAYKDRKIGTIGDLTTTSFFPAKPLGCYGDGGAVFLDDDETVAVLRSLRVHGQGTDKYDNVRIGMNARLDTVQAAVLIEKLRIFAEEIEARQKIAERYSAALRDLVLVPELPDGLTSVWAQYTVRLPPGRDRDQIAAELKSLGVPTAVYYVKPLHRQTAYRDYPVAGNGLPVSERLSEEVLSLPMHPYLEKPVQDRIIAALTEVLR